MNSLPTGPHQVPARRRGEHEPPFTQKGRLSSTDAPQAHDWQTPSEETFAPRSAAAAPSVGPKPAPSAAFDAPSISPAVPGRALSAAPAALSRQESPAPAPATPPVSSGLVAAATAPNPAQRGRTRSARARWEDYLSPSEVHAAEDLAPFPGLVPLEPAPVQPEARPVHRPAPSRPATGPFDVPQHTQALPTSADPHRTLRRVALSLVFVWAAMLLLFKSATPMGMTQLLPGQPLPDGTYGKWSGQITPDLEVLWAIRTDETLTVRLPADWSKRSRLSRITDLQHLKATFPDVSEILVLNPDSELLAETYGDKFHLY